MSDRMLGPRLSNVSLSRWEGTVSVEQVVGFMGDRIFQREGRDSGMKWLKVALGEGGMGRSLGLEIMFDLMVATLFMKNWRKTSQVAGEASRLVLTAGLRMVFIVSKRTFGLLLLFVMRLE